MLTYMAFLVAEEVRSAICLRALARAAMSRNIEGSMYVKTSSALPIEYSRDDRNRHFFASESNQRPFLDAQNMRLNLPKASFRTHMVAASTPNDAMDECACEGRGTSSKRWHLVDGAA